MLGHEIQSSGSGALNRLPALNWEIHGSRHQSYLLQLITAVGNPGGNGVVLALVGKRALIERFEDQLYLLLKQVTVGCLVQQRRAEGLNLAGVVAATNAKDNPAFGQDVRGGVVLGQPKGVPHGGDVETTAKIDSLGQVGQVDDKQQ